MADNTTLPGTGEVYASDEIENEDGDAVNFQIIKLGHGLKDLEPLIASFKDPFPVADNKLEEQNELIIGLLKRTVLLLELSVGMQPDESQNGD